MASHAQKIGADAFRPFDSDHHATDRQDRSDPHTPDQRQIDDARASGHREGYAKGYADGVEAGGAAERTRTISEQADLMRSLSTALSASVEPLFAEMENHRATLTNGARALAEDILMRLAPANQRDLIAEILTTFLQAGEEGEFCRLFVPPDSREAIQDLVEKAAAQKPGSDNASIPIDVHPDASLSSGEVRVDWPGGEIERRLEDAKALIEHYLPYRDEKPETTHDEEPAHD